MKLENKNQNKTAIVSHQGLDYFELVLFDLQIAPEPFQVAIDGVLTQG